VVIPIVLHHGERGWTEPVSLRELSDASAEVLRVCAVSVPGTPRLMARWSAAVP
jgi:hypothetical protein